MQFYGAHDLFPLRDGISSIDLSMRVDPRTVMGHPPVCCIECDPDASPQELSDFTAMVAKLEEKERVCCHACPSPPQWALPFTFQLPFPLAQVGRAALPPGEGSPGYHMYFIPSGLASAVAPELDFPARPARLLALVASEQYDYRSHGGATRLPQAAVVAAPSPAPVTVLFEDDDSGKSPPSGTPLLPQLEVVTSQLAPVTSPHARMPMELTSLSLPPSDEPSSDRTPSPKRHSPNKTDVSMSVDKTHTPVSRAEDEGDAEGLERTFTNPSPGKEAEQASAPSPPAITPVEYPTLSPSGAPGPPSPRTTQSAQTDGASSPPVLSPTYVPSAATKERPDGDGSSATPQSAVGSAPELSPSAVSTPQPPGACSTAVPPVTSGRRSPNTLVADVSDFLARLPCMVPGLSALRPPSIPLPPATGGSISTYPCPLPTSVGDPKCADSTPPATADQSCAASSLDRGPPCNASALAPPSASMPVDTEPPPQQQASLSTLSRPQLPSPAPTAGSPSPTPVPAAAAPVSPPPAGPAHESLGAPSSPDAIPHALPSSPLSPPAASAPSATTATASVAVELPRVVEALIRSLDALPPPPGDDEPLPPPDLDLPPLSPPHGCGSPLPAEGGVDGVVNASNSSPPTAPGRPMDSPPSVPAAAADGDDFEIVDATPVALSLPVVNTHAFPPPSDTPPPAPGPLHGTHTHRAHTPGGAISAPHASHDSYGGRGDALRSDGDPFLEALTAPSSARRRSSREASTNGLECYAP